MVTTEWADLILLFILRLVELCGISYFLSPFEKRSNSRWILVLQILGFALLMTCVRSVIYLVDWEGEFVFISLVYYPILFVFILSKYVLPVKDGIYFLLLIFLCVHPLRPLLMRLSALVFGMNYLVNAVDPFLNLLMVSFYMAALLFEFALLKRYAFRYPEYMLSWIQLCLTIITTIPVVYITNLFLILGTTSDALPMSLMVIAVVCSFCGMATLIGYKNSLAFEKKKQEMATLEALLTSQQKQYQLKKETIEVINARYHDLKKQMNFLVSIESQKEREKYLESFRLQVSAYEAFHDTGNETLDIVLTDKDMDCRKNGIQLLLFVDGAQLNFLQPLDMVTIFSNAIDNGIEAVKKVAVDYRAITVRMHEYDTWLVVTFENPFNGDLKWQGRKLVSTKGEGNEHGYGLINIENAAKKYNGNVTVDANGSQFTLTILFPK